jgi:hypothetical protein
VPFGAPLQVSFETGQPQTSGTAATAQPQHQNHRQEREDEYNIHQIEHAIMKRVASFTSSSSSKSGEDLIFEELEYLAWEGDYIQFFNKLDTYGATPYIVTGGFKLVRHHVVKDQSERPDSVILSGEGWVKTIKDKVEMFKEERDVVMDGLLTLVTLSSLSGNYKKAMVRKGIVGMVLAVMDASKGNKELEELTCSILESLSRNSKDHLNAKFKKIATVIQKLADAVVSSDHGGREIALCALFNLASQRKLSYTTGKTLMHDVQNVLREEHAIQAIVDIICKDDVNEDVALAAVSMLWRLSAFNEEDTGNVTIPITEDLTEAIVMTMQRFNSSGLLEASYGALANMAMEPQFLSLWAHQATGGICHVLLKTPHTDNQGLAICALHAIRNLLASSARGPAGDLLDPQVMQTILKLMRQYPQSKDLIEHGCLAIGHACRDDHGQLVKESVMTNGGFELVYEIFQNHVILRSKNPSLLVKDAALWAIATLSSCQSGAQQIVKSGLLETLEIMLAIEEVIDFKMFLQTIIRNARVGLTATSQPTLDEQPELFLQLLQNARSEEAVLSLLQNLRDLGETGTNAIGNPEFDVLLSTMKRFQNSSAIQAQGCVILADSLIKSGDPFVCRIIYENGIHVIADAMALHGLNVDLVEHACRVLAYIIPNMDTSTIVSLIRLGSSLVGLLERYADVEKMGTVLMDSLVACCVKDKDFKDITVNPNTIRAIVRAIVQLMHKYSSSTELQQNGCSLLSILGGTGNGKLVNGHEGGIVAIVKAMMTHNESPAVLMAGLLALKTLAMASSNKPLIARAGGEDAVLFSVRTHFDNPQIMSVAFSTLNNIAIDYKARIVSQMNKEVISVVADSMQTFLHHEQLQKSACFLLKSYSYLPSNLELFSRHDDQLIHLLLSAAEIFPAQCDAAAMGIVWQLSG